MDGRIACTILGGHLSWCQLQIPASEACNLLVSSLWHCLCGCSGGCWQVSAARLLIDHTVQQVTSHLGAGDTPTVSAQAAEAGRGRTGSYLVVGTCTAPHQGVDISGSRACTCLRSHQAAEQVTLACLGRLTAEDDGQEARNVLVLCRCPGAGFASRAAG